MSLANPAVSLPTLGVSAAPASSRGVWRAAWKRFSQDRVGLAALAVVLAFAALVLAAAAGLVAKDWQTEVALPDAPPTLVGPAPVTPALVIAAPKGPNLDLTPIDPLAPRYGEWAERTKHYQTATIERESTRPFGADRLGRDVLAKVIKGAEVSIMVGLLAALCATLIGTVLGAFSGFFGGRVGDGLEWLYNVFTAIPNILLIFTFAALLNRADSVLPKGMVTIVVILALTGWTGIYRLVRAEFMKHAARDYVRSAEAIGAAPLSRMFKHILPNVSHVVLVQLSILVVAFIKAEVILSYLGLGVSVNQVSWGSMLAESQAELILGHWWQLAATTLVMASFVTAFSLFTDAMRDALDPKLRGLE